MKREQLIPLIAMQKSGKISQVSIRRHVGASLFNYRVLDVGEIYLHGNGPGQGHAPVPLTSIAAVSWTSSERHTIESDPALRPIPVPA